MRTIYHIIARHYETSAERAYRRWQRLRVKAEKFFAKRDAS